MQLERPGAVAWSLEGSYRPWAVMGLAVGLLLLAVGIALGDPTAFFLSLPPLLLGYYLWRDNPRESIVFDEHRGRIWRERLRRGRVEVQVTFPIRDFDRLAFVRYRIPRRGTRAMMVLLGPEQRKEKLDDRPYAPALRSTAKAVAARIGWEFEDHSDQLLQ